MKISTLLLAVAFAVGCSKDKPKQVERPEATPPAIPASKQEDKPPVDVSKNEKVSPTLAISADIAKLCGIKTSGTANPTFDYDKDDLAPEDRAVLDQLAQCLMTGALKGKTVALVGRADPRGTEEYNMGLGSRRAGAVSTYLARLGVGEPQLQATTRGALDATGTDEAGWQKDRRVDIQLAN